MTQALIRGFRVNDYYLADRKTTLEQEIERKSNHLRLPTKGSQQGMNIFWHTNFSSLAT
jgi:hypothetical protein